MTRFTAAPRTVYFIRPVGERGPIKIGVSNRPQTRLGQLETELDAPLEIAAQFPGSMDDERTIQSLFWHSHFRREWFDWSPYLQLVVDAAERGELDMAGFPKAKVRKRQRVNRHEIAA